MEWTEKTATAWYKQRDWANLLQLSVHEPFNVIAFAREYHANRQTWDKVITFLRDRNLDLMPPGKYVIDGDDAYAMITETAGKPLDTAAYESHQQFIDLHYVIKGREDIKIKGSKDSVAVVKPYDAGKDVTLYYLSKGKALAASPSMFFLFFPGEIHQPNIYVKKGALIKKLVIKIKART